MLYVVGAHETSQGAQRLSTEWTKIRVHRLSFDYTSVLARAAGVKPAENVFAHLVKENVKENIAVTT